MEPAEQLDMLEDSLNRLAGRGRRMLLVADNASSAETVKPLIPPGVGNKLLVTSRHVLAGLPRARLEDLDPLDPHAAAKWIDAALLRARPSDPRPVAEPESVARLAELCGSLPLALDLVVPVLTASPGLRVADLVADLVDGNTGLSARSSEPGGGPLSGVRTAFDLSYRRLDAGPARLFRLMAWNPSPDIAGAAVAALAGQTARQTAAQLRDLAQAHMVDERLVGSDRWRMHDLIREYAVDLAGLTAQPKEEKEAVDRLIEYYRSTAQAADACLRGLPGPSEAVGFSSRNEAAHWFMAERQNLLDVSAQADTPGRENSVMSLAFSQTYFRRFAQLWNTGLIGLALHAAKRVDDLHSTGVFYNSAGLVELDAGDTSSAIDDFEAAIRAFHRLNDRLDEAKALSNLGNALCERQARISRETAAASNRIQGTVIFRRFAFRRDGASVFLRLGDEREAPGAALYDEAIAAHRHAIEVFRAFGDRHNEGKALAGLALDLLRAGRLDDGADAGLRAAGIYAEIGDGYGKAEAQTDLAPFLLRAGRHEQAITLLEEAVDAYEGNDSVYLSHRIEADAARALLGTARRMLKRAGRRARLARLTRGLIRPKRTPAADVHLRGADG